MNRVNYLQMLESYRDRGLNLIPLKPWSKAPLVKWKQYKLSNEDFLRFVAQDANWAVRCDEHFHALDFDDAEGYANFLEGKGRLLKEAPTVRTSRGYHIWFKPKRPVSSFSTDGFEVKGLGSLVVVPPSIHPSGADYHFEKPLNGRLPEVNIEELLGSDIIDQVNRQQPATENVPSEFALRYGKSPYPQTLCGKATKILTKSDGRVKHIISLRCWKWDCPKCAPLLRRYWLGKLGSLSFRFIIRLPTTAKPTAFLRHLGKPNYTHIVANGESWLFVADGESQKICEEAKKEGYELILGDIPRDAMPDEMKRYLEQALCPEDKPLNTRRKLTHSRGLFKGQCPVSGCNESKRKYDSAGEDDKKMSDASGKELPTWKYEVVMKPIEDIARELQAEGWQIIWKSEVEAIAVKNKTPGAKDMDIVEFIENVGVRLKKTGKEYKGLCPFHEDHNPSLSVNREKGLWHCFGCGRSGDVHKFLGEWQAHSKRGRVIGAGENIS